MSQRNKLDLDETPLHLRSFDFVMKKPAKRTQEHRTQRNFFAELSEGMKALADARHGKRTLRTQPVRQVLSRRPRKTY